jgi:AbrB family looped-hinge helix DNA binding protein
MSLVRVKQKGQVTIPADIREALGLDEGDLVEVACKGQRIVLTPKEVVDRHPAVDDAIAEGLTDARRGRLTPKFRSAEAYVAWTKTAEGRKFRRRKR